jgi:chemotaxis protein MotB
MSSEDHDVPPEEAPLEEAPPETAVEPPLEAGSEHAEHPEEHADEHAKHHGHGKHAPHAAAGPGAPLWMLSFADMMTNLLCFFILLSAFAQKQEGVLLEDGLGSIQRALLSIGLPGTMDGRTNPVQFNAGRVVYRSAASVNPKTLVEADGRILDSNRDTLRQVIVEALAQRGSATLPLPLLFEGDSADLTQGHKVFLDEVAKYLVSGAFKIRIDGYAFEEAGLDPAAGWTIAEARARASRDYLVGRGIAPARISWIGHGLLQYGPNTKAGAAANVQNRFGRRAVLVTFVG